MASTHSQLYQALLAALVEARKAAGITQTDLAARIGKRQTFISKYELGERRLDVAEYIEIARAMGAEPYPMLKAAEDVTKL